MTGRFLRVAETNRPSLTVFVDGRPVQALEGDTLLVAILSGDTHVRDSEFGEGRRAGFCLMAACQDCWVWTAAGGRLRACSTVAQDGMSINTRPPEAPWANLG